MKSIIASSLSRRALWLLFLLLAGTVSTAYLLADRSTAQIDGLARKNTDKIIADPNEPAELTA